MQQQCGDWRLDREIGRGAYGTVHLAVGPSGECAAVKLCRRDVVGDERYERELRGAKLYVSIPPQEGLVHMRGLFVAKWGFYTVMDLADDEFGRPLDSPDGYRPKTLASVIDGEKALPLKECVKLALSLANGLAALQRHHLLHRDIKPGNVLYVGGCPVLSDPGLIVEESDAASLVGTPGYVPPEKFIDPASDIYSLGLTLKAASFGRRIEDLDKGPAMEADTGAVLFPAWWRILNKATDPASSRRYQSAKALIKDLKMLRLKMAVASKFGSRIAKAAIIAVPIAVVALVVSNGQMSKEVSGLRRFKTDIEKNIEEGKRDAQWSALVIHFGSADMYEMRVDREIERVSATNKTQGVELRSLLGAIKSLDKKNDERHDEMSLLLEIARGKRKNGLSDEKEFEKASNLKKEIKRTEEEMRSIYDKICERLGVDK